MELTRFAMKLFNSNIVVRHMKYVMGMKSDIK